MPEPQREPKRMKSVPVQMHVEDLPEATLNTLENLEQPYPVVYEGEPHWRTMTKEATIDYIQKTYGVPRDEITDNYNRAYLGNFARMFPTHVRIGKDSMDEWVLEENMPEEEGYPVEEVKTESQMKSMQEKFLYNYHKYDPTGTLEELNNIIDTYNSKGLK